MHKKLMAACVSLVAFAAFAIAPALASASPVLTYSSDGTAVPAGKAVTGQSTNVVLTTGSGNITCQTADLVGELTKNNGTEVEGKMTSASYTGTGTSSRCTSTISDLLGGTVTAQVTVENLPWCLKATAGEEMVWHLNACTAGQNLKFTLHLFNHFGSALTTCVYEAATVTGTYATNVTANALTASEQPFTSSSGGVCPATGKVDQTVTLTAKRKVKEEEPEVLVSTTIS